MSLKYPIEIAKIESTLPHKFLIVLKDEKLLYYAFSMYLGGEEMLHRDIASHFSLSPHDVLSGGQLDICDEKMEINPVSNHFGYTPPEIIDELKKILPNAYKKYGNIKDVLIDMPFHIPHLNEKWNKIIIE